MSEETHPGEAQTGEAQTSVGTPDYMEKARELADSYPQLLVKQILYGTHSIWYNLYWKS